jgi:type IV fimbrial biogenesis protein FimT
VLALKQESLLMRVKLSALLKSREKGFTLIELMVTLALAIIIATIAVPSYRAFIVNQQLTAASGDFMASLLQARSEAVRLGRNVALAPADGTDWRSGWNVFLDADCTGTYSAANSATNTLIITSPAMGPAVSIDPAPTRTTLPFSLASPYFAYAPSGFLLPYSCAYAASLGNGTLWLTATETGRSRAIKVAITGRARVCSPSPTDDCLGN